jgi:hypothetical protein
MTIGAPLFYPIGPIDILDGTVTRLQAIQAFKNVYEQRTFPTKDDQLPFAAVWHAGERTEPNGDANVGAPSFFHTLTLVVDVVTSGPDETTLKTNIVQLVETTRATLLTDGSWVQLFEGIERCDTRYNFPKETNLIVAEAVIEFQVTFRSEWPPNEANDFATLGVDARPDGATATVFSTQFDLETGSDENY